MTTPLEAEVTPTAQLAGRVTRLRTRVGEGGADRAVLAVGGMLLPLGILLVILGWLGASHTVLVFEQIPYMVSGGFLGLALVFVGGFVYFNYWQTLLVREARSHNEQVVAGLARIEALLAGTAAPRRRAAGEFVATPTGSMIHRPDCAVVASRDDLRPVAADAAGFEPCRICQALTVETG